MLNQAPNPARCTSRWAVPAHPPQGAALPVIDLATLRGQGTPDDPLRVDNAELCRMLQESLHTAPSPPAFEIHMGPGDGFAIPPRYRQIVHNRQKSVFSPGKGGYYYIMLKTAFDSVMDSCRVSMTLWRNNNRVDGGASGSLCSKECPATEPMILCGIFPLDPGDDVWFTLWHDGTSPIEPKELDILILSAFEHRIRENPAE